MYVCEEERTIWSMILAGGDGQRMRPLIRRWLGRHKPKQYCTFVGTRSMFQHTLDRADMLSKPEKRVTVVARSHRAEVRRQLQGRAAGSVLLQPANHDTAAGIFLALTYIRARDPHAAVAIFPSDHFIYPEHLFVDTVRRAAQALETWPEQIVLLGAAPDRPEPEYGWIQPGSELGWCSGLSIRAVESFVEKPCAEKAQQVMEEGALWNTFVLLANVETLWNLGQHHFPRIVELFEGVQESVGNESEMSVLNGIYREMPKHNFSSGLLAKVAGHVAVVELRDVVWSDWGRPERIADVLDTLGKEPAFPRECLLAS